MLQFEESFFEGETRHDFYIEPMMKRAWAASMEVLAEIDRICKKHGIMYFAYWGTLLGAIRHKGFIPWDDDIDIAMLRPDYQRFMQIAPEEFQKPFELISIYTDQEWNDMLYRVINGRSFDMTQEHLEQFHGCPYLVGIDVFPLDFASRNQEEDEVQLQLVDIILNAADLADKYERDECTLEEMVGVLSQVEDLCNIRFDVKRPLAQQARILAEQVCTLYGEEDADEVGIILKRITNRPNFHMPKEYYAKAVELPFEQMMIPVPAGYDEILKLMYGDYMQMLNVGGGHEYPFYRGQQEQVEQWLKEHS